MSKLIIVESPGKIKKIKSYLGSDYNVLASVGHIRDLAKSSISVDVNNKFNPTYEISTDKKEVVKNLKKAVAIADEIYIAADGDREGEAIAFHLVDVLKIKKYKRIVFNEITQTAINNAISNPRLIDMNMFYSQQTRRILDRIVGYKLSPILKAIPDIESKSLGAGRVQSVVLRLIVDNEKEIETFLNTTSLSIYDIQCNFNINNFNIKGHYITDNDITTKKEIKDIVLIVKENTVFIIKNIEIKDRISNPQQPFITSTLQQEASYKLKYPLKKTMFIAQKLYEKGLITYMRTDSTTLSNDAINYIKKIVCEDYTEEYYQYRQFKNKNNLAQEAHEAIRPTNFSIKSIDSEENALYELIWKRTVASQMKSAKYTDQIILLTNSKIEFMCKSSILLFDGYKKVYNDTEDTKEGIKLNNQNLLDNKVNWESIVFKETFKNAPTRYNEASLVKQLETLGIGRPSTYASTISKIQEHNYVKIMNIDGIDKKITTFILHYDKLKFEKEQSIQKIGNEKNKLIPTKDGIIITEYLINNFNQIMDYKFTANMELSLDEIAEGTKVWYEILDEFYNMLKEQFTKININMESTIIKKQNHFIVGTHTKYGDIYYVETKYGPTYKIKKGKKDMFVKANKLNESNLEDIKAKSLIAFNF